MRRTVLFAGLALIVSGCSKSMPSDPPRVVPLTGTLTYKNLPIRSAQLTFRADELPEPAFAITDAQGRFSGMTNETAGVIPGDYQVTVSSRTVKIPQKYAQAGTSPLRVSVKDGAQNAFSLVLED